MGGILSNMMGGSGKEGAILGELMKLLKPGGGIGGVQGLVERFQQHGMGGQVQSWLGDGDNQPVSGAQVRQAIGQENVEQVAQGAGVSQQEASDGIAKILPHAVDQLTPGGQVPQGDDLTSRLGGLAGKLFGRAA
jgi:uncharacterized protein YidB (DUF937 family)